MNRLTEFYCILGCTTKARHYKSFNQLMVQRGRVRVKNNHKKVDIWYKEYE